MLRLLLLLPGAQPHCCCACHTCAAAGHAPAVLLQLRLPPQQDIYQLLLLILLRTHLPSASHSLRSTMARRREMIGGRNFVGPTFLNCSAASPNRRSMCDIVLIPQMSSNVNRLCAWIGGRRQQQQVKQHRWYQQRRASEM
jgi:hypothetical protein